MRAVKTAEKQLWEIESTKAYTALAGDPAFTDAMVGLVLGDAVPRDHVKVYVTAKTAEEVAALAAVREAAAQERATKLAEKLAS